MMKKIFLVTLMMLVFIFAQAQTTYYVSLAGNDGNDGLSEATAWRTFSYAASVASPVTGGDMVYIKAGDYGTEAFEIEKNYAVNDAPISFIGYQLVPDDINSLNFAYGDDVDAAIMPLYNHNDRTTGGGITLIDSYSITIKNIQIANNQEGISISNSNSINSKHTLENIFLKNIGWAYSTAIGTKNANENTIKNCLIINATGAGMDLGGNNNLIEDCKVYSDESVFVAINEYTSMDYFIVLNGNNNIVNNCYAERVGDLEDVGHGLEVKDSGESNLFVNCTSKNMESGCFSVRWASAKNNEFRNCTALGGASEGTVAFMVREGASLNEFNSCISDNCDIGIQFLSVGEDADYAGKDNIFNNCIFNNAQSVIDFNAYGIAGSADNNKLANCVINKATYLFNSERSNIKNQLVNCIIQDVDNLVIGSKPLDCTYHYCDFFSNGFAAPAGEQIISGDPLFVAAGDYHLSAGSPCIDNGTSTSAPLFDFDGTARPQGLSFDIGGFEYLAPLPVIYLDFSARKNGNSILLNWVTTFENNNQGFEVQHSSNGLDWHKIGFVKERGTIRNYKYKHSLPLAGANYYRLKQFDLDGYFEYSTIQVVYLPLEKEPIIYPNPFKDILIFSKEIRKGNLYNQMGELVLQFDFDTQESHALDVRRLPNGTYHLLYFGRNGSRFNGLFVKD